MKTAVIVTVVILALLVSGTSVAYRSGSRMMQEGGMGQVLAAGDKYMVENYPWTYGSYAGVRDWYYNP